MKSEVVMKNMESFEIDLIQTSAGELSITFLGHASLILGFGGKIMHVDPFGNVADYSKLPKADIILSTHEHYDHLDEQAVASIRTDETILVMNPAGAEKFKGTIVMRNGDKKTVAGIPIEVVPAYNIQHKRDNGQPFHPKGIGNGYILSFGDTRLYLAGDTENIPEMKELRDIRIAFLPMNLPYTMTPEMMANAAKTIKPRILYPYHFGDTEVAKLVDLLKTEPEIEIRIRKMA